MKKVFFILLFLFFGLFTHAQLNNLQLKGIIDFDLLSAGYTGKALHLKANTNITDLSNYGIGVANNGNGGDGQEYTFASISVQSGDHILLVRDSQAMANYFDNCFIQFDHILVATNAIDQNGDDAIELYKDSLVIETFGDISYTGLGSSLPWNYLDSWAYKTGSSSSSFNISEWVFGGVECTVGSLTTQSSSCPYLFCASSSINNNSINSQLNLYPNPANQFINIDSYYLKDNIQIFDALGNKISSFEIKNNKINIKNLSNGIYFLKLNFEEKTFSQKFIKN
tara:strand:+ start:170 stop:1015 length:846 start_codon:yes stop_codon:yes gene_type:complete